VRWVGLFSGTVEMAKWTDEEIEKLKEGIAFCMFNSKFSTNIMVIIDNPQITEISTLPIQFGRIYVGALSTQYI